MLRNKVLEDINAFARKNTEASDYTYGMIFNFKYKDYDQIIEDIDAQVFDNLSLEDKEIVKEIVDCVCDITGRDCYLTIDEPDTPQTITCVDSGVDSLAHNEHTIDLFESSISDSFDTTFGKLDFQNKVKDDNDKQDIIDAATKIVRDTNEEAKEYSDQELSDEAEKSFEDNKQKSAIENGTTTETKEAQEKIEQYEMQESALREDELSEIFNNASILCSDEHKKDTRTGQFYGYGHLEYGSKEIPFSFNTKTGEIDLTGNPWNWIEKELEKNPYTLKEKNFFIKYSKEIASMLKKSGFLYFDGAKWSKKY